MLFTIVALQLIVLVAVAALWLRKPVAPAPDAALVALPDQLTRLVAEEARRTREDHAGTAGALRGEVIAGIATLGQGLKDDLRSFREDNTASAEKLRTDVEQKMRAISQGFADFKNETGAKHASLEESLNRRLIELMESNAAHQEKLRSSVEERLNKLNVDNTAKLEEMRATVDEKLHATLQTRLTESFGQVTDQLTRVHAGLGEMTKLSAGVNDLSRIFTNVKSRGQFAEAMLDNLLKQMLGPSQFVRNAQVKPGTQEAVEFAVRFPGPHGDVLLPIDSKFPRETWDRLETAYETGSASDIASARKAFENAIRTEAKRICSKYINEPVTTPNAVMFLPTEGLYAEVMRRDGLHDDIQQNCHVMIAGPSNLSAILTSFQMVFQLVNLQKKGSEVWNVLAAARGEFGKFGLLMDKMDKQVGTVQNTIRDLGTRTRAINKTLREVSADSPDAQLPATAQSAFDGLLPILAASEGEE
ncbi:MAG TPA: DNA recombination protein RmuC [Acidobacteriaceae bacterium]|nr:DNA recombination protein RmuC [Acidobacteriaceae bacterium]